jgi:hypothetical protein
MQLQGHVEPPAGFAPDLIEGAHVDKSEAIVEMQMASLAAATRASGVGKP